MGLSSEDHGLYGLQMFDRVNILTVRKRLGRLRTFDLTRCDEDQLIPTDRDLRLSMTFTQRVEEAQHDEELMQKVLRQMHLRDDISSKGNANKYVLDLSLFEDWMCTCVLLMLAAKEAG